MIFPREKAMQKIRSRRHYEKNKEIMKARARAWYAEHRENVKARVRQYAIDNYEVVSARRKEYQKAHKAERNAYLRQQKKENIQHKLRVALRGRLYMAIKDNAKSGSAVKDLGCTIPELKFYLEGKFKDGMTWDNYGQWHIDHVIPLAFFDLSIREQFLQACHYTNLQPLWAEENLKKADKVITNKTL